MKQKSGHKGIQIHTKEKIKVSSRSLIIVNPHKHFTVIVILFFLFVKIDIFL